MVGVSTVVSIEDRRPFEVGDEKIQVAVIVIVEGQEAPPLVGIGHAEPGGDVGKYAGAVVFEEPGLIIEVQSRLSGRPTVGMGQVEVSVVVEVEKVGPPSPTAVADPGGVGDIRKGSISVVVI